MYEPLLIDASAFLAVLFQEEGAEGFEEALAEYTLLAPELIKYEAANGILLAQKRQRFKRSASQESFLNIILDFPIEDVPLDVWWPHSIALIKRHNMTFYDAAYVAAAISLGFPLLSLDKKMKAVMRAEKIPAPSL